MTDPYLPPRYLPFAPSSEDGPPVKEHPEFLEFIAAYPPSKSSDKRPVPYIVDGRRAGLLWQPSGSGNSIEIG